MENIGDTKCRLCLSCSEIVQNLFATDSKYLFFIEEFTGLKIVNRPEFPSVICGICANTIKLLKEFKAKCIKSQEILEQKDKFAKYELLNITENSILNTESILDIKEEEIEENEIIYNNTNNKEDVENNEELPKPTDSFISHNEQRKSKKIKAKSKTRIKTNSKIIKNGKNSLGKNEIFENETNHGSNEFEKESNKEPEAKQWKKYARSYKTSCYICGKLFYKFRIDYHINSHLGLRPFECKEVNCKKKFASPTQLRQHIVYTHSNNAPHECNICNRRFKSKSALREHQTYHFDPQLPCKVCGKLLRNRKSLKKHMFNHTGERPYVCDVCSKSFKNQWSLKVHLRIHTQEKPFVCTHCGMSFRYSSGLKHHTEKNHSENSLNCTQTSIIYSIADNVT